MVLVIIEGFYDLLYIGNQIRFNIFDLVSNFFKIGKRSVFILSEGCQRFFYVINICLGVWKYSQVLDDNNTI